MAKEVCAGVGLLEGFIAESERHGGSRLTVEESREMVRVAREMVALMCRFVQLAESLEANTGRSPSAASSIAKRG